MDNNEEIKYGFVFREPVRVADEGSYNDAVNLLENEDVIDPLARSRFNDNNRSSFEMSPLHTKKRLIRISKTHDALLWNNPKDPTNPDYMVAVVFQLSLGPDSALKRTLCGVIAGKEFQGVIEYRKSCCGDDETGMSALVVLEGEQGPEFYVRDSIQTRSSFQKLFENAPDGVIISSAKVQHIYEHANQGAECGHSHDFLPPVMPILAR